MVGPVRRDFSLVSTPHACVYEGERTRFLVVVVRSVFLSSFLCPSVSLILLYDGLSRSFRADACVSDLSRPSRINAASAVCFVPLSLPPGQRPGR